MPSSPLRAAVACAAAAVAANAFVWIGESLSADGSAAQIVSLAADGSVASTLNSIPIGQEAAHTDTFRCVPYGEFCSMLTYETASGGSIASFHYNLTTTGQLVAKTPLGAVDARTLHLRLQTGMSYTVAVTNGGAGAAVLSVIGNQPPQQVVDLSQYWQPGYDAVSTQCSDKNILFTALTNGTGGGVMVTASLNDGTITAVQPLNVSFNALWAECDDATGYNVLGGTVVAPGPNGQLVLQYGTLSAAGAFQPATTVTLPAGYAPNGLLSEPVNFDIFATVYPTGSAPGTNVGGYLAQWNDNAPTMQLSPLSYYLLGAARVQ